MPLNVSPKAVLSGNTLDASRAETGTAEFELAHRDEAARYDPREDLEALRIPLIALGATLLVALVMIWYSGNVLDMRDRTRDAARKPSFGKHARASRTPARKSR